MLANLANGEETQQNAIVTHPRILSSLQMCLADSKADIRRPALSCVLTLVKSNASTRQYIREAGIISTLKHISEWGSGIPASPGGARVSQSHTSPSVLSLVEDDKYVINEARLALDFLEHDDVYS